MGASDCRAFVLTAPSGTGKTTLCTRLMARHPELKFSVSATTRAPRPGEVDGKDYYFLTPETYRQWLAEGRFLENAEVHGNLYGTPREALLQQLREGFYVLIDVDVQGAREIHARMPEAHLIFLMPPSFEVLSARLRGRGTDAPDVIERRLSKAQAEMAERVWFDYVVVNDDLDRAEKELEAIIFGGEKL